MMANVFAEDLRAYLEAGINELADKPVKPDKLFAASIKWLSP